MQLGKKRKDMAAREGKEIRNVAPLRGYQSKARLKRRSIKPAEERESRTLWWWNRKSDEKSGQAFE